MVSDVLSCGEARQLGRLERHDTLQARNSRFAEGDAITMRVRRSRTAALAEFRIPYRKWMRVLDALNWVAENQAPDLAYRWFCGSKMCGTCAVRMNGREVLACWEAVEPDMTIEPLRNLPIIRDLVVERGPFDRKVAQLEPWLERSQAYCGFPEPLSHTEMKNASKALDCIGCMCCYSACPVIGLGNLTDFAGPGPLVQLGQTALDPRNDASKVARSLALTGIFNCVSCYKCEEVCPASIPIVSQVIEPLKAKAAALVPEMAKHSSALRAIVAVRGYVDPSALLLKVRGLKALFDLPRAVRLLIRGKIDPIKTFLKRKTPASSAASRYLAAQSHRTKCSDGTSVQADQQTRTPPPERGRSASGSEPGGGPAATNSTND